MLHIFFFSFIGKDNFTELNAKCLQISYVEANMAKAPAFAS